MNGNDFVTRREYDRLTADVDFLKGRVMAHDAMIPKIARDLTNIRAEVHELSNWKDDSKVQEIAFLKGKIKRSDRWKDRVLTTLLLGGTLEILRLVLERFFPHGLH